MPTRSSAAQRAALSSPSAERSAALSSYREAWQAWMKQIERVHEVLLEGNEQLTPDRLKGLLNREARTKQAYDEARRSLLGLDEAVGPLPDSDENPFR